MCPAVLCEFGQEVDDRGCKTCKCKPIPNVCPMMACPTLFCEFGTAVDANGCTTCQCNPNPCVVSSI